MPINSQSDMSAVGLPGAFFLHDCWAYAATTIDRLRRIADGDASNPLIDAIEPVRITDHPCEKSGKAFCTAKDIDEEHVDAPLRHHDLVNAINVGELGRVALDRGDLLLDCSDRLFQFGLPDAR